MKIRQLKAVLFYVVRGLEDMEKIKNKVKKFIDSIWFLVLLSLLTVFSFILDIPYFGFYTAVTCLLVMVLLKTDFKAVLPIIFLLFGNHQTFTRNYSDPWLVLLIVYFGVVVIIFLCNLIMDYRNFFKPLSKDLVFYSFLAITVSMLISLINTPVMNESLVGITLWLTILFSYLLVRATVDPTEENKEKMILSILFSGLVLCAMVIYKLFQGLVSNHSMQDLIKYDLNLGWAHINHVAAFVNICIILANYYFIKYKSIWKKGFALISVALYCFVSAISLCRGGYLTLVFIVPLLIIVNIVCLFKSTKTLKIKLIYLGGFFVSIGIVLLILQLTGILPVLFTKLTEKGFDPSGRKEVYKVAIARFKAHPIIGQGVYSARYYLEYLHFNIFNYHNYYLQMLGTCGIFGTLAFTCFLVFAIKRIIKNNLFSLFTIIVMLYFLIHGALDTLFFNAYIMSVLCILLALTNDTKIKDEFPSLFQKKNDENNDELGNPEIETD